MKKEPEYNTSRREFLKSMVRTGLFGGLLALGTGLVYRRFSRTESMQSCDFVSPCETCFKLSNCDLPKAISARNSNNLIDSPKRKSGVNNG